LIALAWIGRLNPLASFYKRIQTVTSA